MKQTPPLKITVANPCSENWTAMEEKEGGRFCSNCQKVVVDFSMLTDKELFAYFGLATSIPCGRFHNNQLNKIIFPEKRQQFSWKNLYKAAATLLAFLSLKYSGIASAGNKAITTIQSLSLSHPLQNPEKTVISGTVRDKDDKAVENAEITLEGAIVAKTDANGKFEFEIPEHLQGKSFLLVISYPGQMSIIRNYHPNMQSTSYDVNFQPPTSCCFYTMGFPSKIYFPETIVSFLKENKKLSDETKKDLAGLAVLMRNNPDVSVNISGNQKTAALYMQLIKTYLIDGEGISDDRFDIIPDEELEKNIIVIRKAE